MADAAPVTTYVPKPVSPRLPARKPGKGMTAASSAAKQPTAGVKRPDPVQLAAILKMFSKGR